MEVVLDLRCLQDPLFARRGVGRYAEAVLRFAPRGRARLTGLLDPALPPLAPELGEELHDALHGVRHTAYTGALAEPVAFVSFSPLTHDPLFTARLLHHPDVLGVAVVDNLLPLQEPGRYMPGAEARLDCHVSLRWLARHRLFLVTHAEAGAALGRTLGVKPGEVVDTGAPAAPACDAGGSRHVLVVANGDARREPEVAVLAHARSRAMQDGGIPLVVVGALGDAWLDGQRAAAKAAGGRPDLLEAPGRVDGATLRCLHQHALCVVAPARADGFPFGGAEAAAAGVPVLASRIPAHAAILGEGALFAAGNHAELSALLDRMAGPWRAEVAAAQSGVRQACDPARVAERFWDAVLGRARPVAAPSVQRGARPRLAFMLPARSPDAAYGRALCGALGCVADLDVCDTASEPSSPFPFVSSDYDRVLVFGDAGIATRRHLIRHGGAWLGDLDGALPDAELLAAAEPVLLHSPAALRALAGMHNGTRHGALHLPCGLAAPATYGAPRHAPGPGQVALVVLDAHAARAALADCVWALELLRSWGVDAALHIPCAGPVPDTLRALSASLGVAAHVRFGGAAWGAEVGVGLDVRAGAHLGAPVALVGGLAGGLRCVASASLAEGAGAPAHACAMPDNISPVRLAEAVLHALDQPPPADAECRAYADARSMDRTAAHLLRLLGL